jgi:hypothetical protein
MNARSYRIDLRHTPLDFPAITGIGESHFTGASEPHLNGDKLGLNIVEQYVLIDMNSNQQYSILAVQSLYQIPTSEVKSSEDVYGFYKDAIVAWNEVYQHAEADMPTLHKTVFPTPPIEKFKTEIDRVFSLLNNRN